VWRNRRAEVGESGFTVAEVLIASAVLLVVVIAAMSAIQVAANASLRSQRRVEAMALASKQVELARNLPFDQVACNPSQNGLPAGSIPGVEKSGIYTITSNIAYGTYGASPASMYKTMSVTVSWSTPTSGSVSASTMISGASGTQDYNFGNVSLQVVSDVASAPLAGVTVQLTDPNGRHYSQVTTGSGVASFIYVPSGNISFVSTYPGRFVDAPISPTCVANVSTAYGPVVAHSYRTGTIRFLDTSGTPYPNLPVALTAGPSTVDPVTTDSNGYATFSQELINGTYTVGITHQYYTIPGATYLTINGADVSMNVNLLVQPGTVRCLDNTAKNAGASGTVYVWNPDGTLYASGAAQKSQSYYATLTPTPPNINPRKYYFTNTNSYVATNALTVTPGQYYQITVY
jgi:hypothetical protein